MGTVVPILQGHTLLQWKSGFIRGVAFLERENLVVFYDLSAF
jgi:hypothetical protein